MIEYLKGKKMHTTRDVISQSAKGLPQSTNQNNNTPRNEKKKINELRAHTKKTLQWISNEKKNTLRIVDVITHKTTESHTELDPTRHKIKSETHQQNRSRNEKKKHFLIFSNYLTLRVLNGMNIHKNHTYAQDNNKTSVRKKKHKIKYKRAKENQINK